MRHHLHTVQENKPVSQGERDGGLHSDQNFGGDNLSRNNRRLEPAQVSKARYRHLIDFPPRRSSKFLWSGSCLSRCGTRWIHLMRFHDALIAFGFVVCRGFGSSGMVFALVCSRTATLAAGGFAVLQAECVTFGPALLDGDDSDLSGNRRRGMKPGVPRACRDRSSRQASSVQRSD